MAGEETEGGMASGASATSGASDVASVPVRIAGAVNDSIVDGPGIRLAVFVQGCSHGCPGCQNPETHDPDAGYVKTVDQIEAVLAANPLLDGLTLSGGEPMEQAVPLIGLADAAHALGLNVWCYTGYLLEQLEKGQPSDAAAELLNHIDVLVDGPFVLDERSLDLRWRGSANQRVIDMAKTRATGAVVLFCE